MSLPGLVAGFVVLTVVFGAVEWRPAKVPRGWKDRSIRTDIAFWFFTPLVAGTITRIALAASLIGLALLLGRHVELRHVEALLTANGPVASQPRWLQALEVLLLADGLGYWMHRLFHGRALWPFHAVHHGSEHLDWLSSVRLHPVNEALMRIAQVVPLVLFGFDPRVLAASVPIFTLYALFLHANVNWRFGALGYVIATPAFHRWHHAADATALDKNFAGLFPLWDLVFGTFYLPTRSPERFGLADGHMPEGLWEQLRFPFKTRS
jgi:sterol desaturase/sphingolipid hydroxylase (fatty acid hydroxylase superfamily)